MGTIGINNLYIAKMPNSCKECPLTYLDTGDDVYFGAYEKRCVIDDSCVDGMVSERAYDCPLVEAIPRDQYEARLKADMVAMLEDLRLDFQEAELAGVLDNKELIFADEVDDLVQQKINSLKED